MEINLPSTTSRQSSCTFDGPSTVTANAPAPAFVVSITNSHGLS